MNENDKVPSESLGKEELSLAGKSSVAVLIFIALWLASVLCATVYGFFYTDDSKYTNFTNDNSAAQIELEPLDDTELEEEVDDLEEW